MKTIDEQLEDALARITQLESDATASASLLTESGHQHERFRQEIATLTKEKEALAASTSAEQIAALSAEKETLTLQPAQLRASPARVQQPVRRVLQGTGQPARPSMQSRGPASAASVFAVVHDARVQQIWFGPCDHRRRPGGSYRFVAAEHGGPVGMLTATAAPTSPFQRTWTVQ
jgi:hypothetical protein